MAATETQAVAMHVHRVEIHPAPGEPDPLAHAAAAEASETLAKKLDVRSAHIYLIEAPITREQVQQIAEQLLCDPIAQRVTIGVSSHEQAGSVVEVHYKPGVMDPVAQSTREAIVEMLPELDIDQVEVRTGVRYDFKSADTKMLVSFAERYLANPVIQDIHDRAFAPAAFEKGSPYELRITHVPIRDLDAAALEKLSREGHLFLSLDEMQAIQNYYRSVDREPTDIELETLAQTWSEHCVHKTLKSTVRYEEAKGATPGIKEWAGRAGHKVQADGSLVIDNLLKRTVAAATNELIAQDPRIKEWCISVFVDNAGIVGFDEQDAVCIKVETHNHPSAIEPYGGAATGIGGCIRDVLGTGLAARPIANTNVFSVASPNTTELPKGVIHPRRVLQRVVAGVRDYGNRMGIPTVNGAVYFHPGYLANPLVFAGCIGLIPRDKCFGSARPGDHIIAMGGRTGRDGIHGATFSSAELTDTHADEFSHAVQIGNAITQKKMLDVIIAARDYKASADAKPVTLFSAITDCGAGGFSSAVGEMGEKVGAFVNLEQAPLKYRGLSYTEIWISEAQERMVLSVPEENLATLRSLCEAENVEMCDLGTFGQTDADGNPLLVLNYKGTEVGRQSMHLLHEGIPQPTREARWQPAGLGSVSHDTPGSESAHDEIGALLTALLEHPNIASKHWIIRQYDHEVQGGSAVKPLVGPHQDGPSDAAVVRPKLESNRGVAVACGLAPSLADPTLADDADAYWMVLAAVDEAVRNAVCVGADPSHIAILDNFCWPSCGNPQQLATLVRAAQGCYDGAMAFRTPFVSGKDSLNNQFTTEDGRLIAIPPTLLITAMGIVPDVNRCRTMDAKQAGSTLLLVGNTTAALGGSHLRMLGKIDANAIDRRIPRACLDVGPRTAKAVSDIIAQSLVASAHDVSDGGLLVAAAEMAFAGRVGLELDLAAVPHEGDISLLARAFAETPSRYLLEVERGNLARVEGILKQAGIAFGRVGTFADHQHLVVSDGSDKVATLELDDLRNAWQHPLDW